MPEIIDRRISFSGGEFSPFTDPRLDLEKYRSACRILRNFRPSVYGGAFSRPGTVFVHEQRDHDKACRLVPFEFNVTTTMILEFGEGYVRPFYTGANPGPVIAPLGPAWATGQAYVRGQFLSNSGSNYYVRSNHTSTSIAADIVSGFLVQQDEFEIPTDYLEADLDALQFAQLNDLIHIVHPNHPPSILSRFAADNWTFELFVTEWPATLEENKTATTITASAVTGTPTLTASAGIFSPGDVGSRWIISHRREDPTVSMNLSNAAQGNVTAPLFVLDQWSASIRAGGTGGAHESDVVIERSYDKVTWETLRTLTSTKASLQVVVAGTELESCWLRIRYLKKVGTGQPESLTAELEAVDPTHYGIVEITGYTSATSVTASVVFELGATTATKYWSEAAWSDKNGWPRSLTLHEDRIWFAGNSARPQTVWGSIIDDFGNFRLGSDADVGLSFKASSDAANGIQWIISQEALIVGTTGSEWNFGSRSQQVELSSDNYRMKRSTSYGSAHIQPRVMQDATLFVQKSGRIIREFVYTFEKDGFSAQNLTLLSEHITDGQIRQVTGQKQPETILWAITGDGLLIGLVYERGQNVAGWFRYDTQGLFESVACVSGTGEEDELWVSVKRVIDGETKRYIERFQPDTIRRLKDGENKKLVYSDAARVYDGEPTTIIDGLDHLEGMEVVALADGSPVAGLTVLGGEIELQAPASVVVVGLQYLPEIEPTWLETGDPNSVSKVASKRITRVDIGLWKSLGLEFADAVRLQWLALDFTAPNAVTDQAIPLFTGIKSGEVTGDYEQETSIRIRQTQPLPLNIQHLHIRYDLAMTP